MRDVLDLQVAHLKILPIATSLELRCGSSSARIVWTTSGKAWEAARVAGKAPWAPSEYEAFALGVELERAFVGDLGRWSDAKIGGRFVVDIALVIGGAAALLPFEDRTQEVRVAPRRYETVVVERTRVEGRQGAPSSTFGELFERLGVDLVGVELHPRTGKSEVTAQTWSAM